MTEQSTSKPFVVKAAEQPARGGSADPQWRHYAGNPQDEGQYVELVSAEVTGSSQLLFGLGWVAQVKHICATTIPIWRSSIT
jgi:hypothetical protein